MLHPAKSRPYKQKQVPWYIEESLRSMNTLTAQMRCQRGEFRLDESVKLGDPYDETTMENAGPTEVEDGMQAFVVAVLSKGWIRVPPKEISTEEFHICKARVLVELFQQGQQSVD